MVILIPRITSNDMRSILHRLMERDRYYFAYELDNPLRREMTRIEAVTNKRAKTCRDWTQRVAQLLSNDRLINIRVEFGRYWWYRSPINKYCLAMDENDIQYYVR